MAETSSTAPNEIKYEKVKAEKVKEKKQKITKKKLKKQKTLIFMSIPFVIYIIIFNYLPIGGWIMAFENYKPAKGFLGSKFVGTEKFEFLLGDDLFKSAFINTLGMSFIIIVLGFIFSIGFALLLNEVVNKPGKKFVQTISYLPHFLSWVIVAGLVQDILNSDGVINNMLMGAGIIDSPILFFQKKEYFWWIVGFTNVWKETGWGSIIYLSAMTAINPDIYEAASIDGAGRFRKMWNVTLPGIKPTILILLIMNLGNILNAGFELQYLLGNDVISESSEIIDTFILRYGIRQTDFSLATAAGIFKSVISFGLVFFANQIAKWSGEERLF